MIKVYKIKVGEKVYEVEVESISEKEGKILESEKQGTKLQKEQIGDKVGEKIESPMQGLVVSVNVSMGQKVKIGETLVVIEAMKMENPIVSHIDGVVTGIEVSKGDTVQGGDTLVTIC